MDDLPLGFGMALAQNAAAMERFAQLPEAARQALVEGARAVRSKDEMRAYVDRISS